MPFEVLILICLKWLYDSLFELFRFYGGDSLQEHFRLFQIFFFVSDFFKRCFERVSFFFFFFFFFSFFICFWIVVLYFGLVFRILCHWRTHWVSTSGAVRTSLVERTLNCRITLVGFNDGLCHYDYFFLLPVLTHSFLFIFFLGFRITIALCMLHNGTLVWISIIHFLKSDNVFRDVSFLGVGIRTVNWFFFDTSSVICSFFFFGHHLDCFVIIPWQFCIHDVLWANVFFFLRSWL